MRLFPVELKPGVPAYEQVLYAARKAIVSGDLKPGDAFPSVRTLSAEFQLNPNTVQKALAALKREGLVETLPGIGNRVCKRPEGSAADRTELLSDSLEALVLRAKQLHLPLDEVISSLRSHWRNL
jgi:GntR family transcriptional regulator